MSTNYSNSIYDNFEFCNFLQVVLNDIFLHFMSSDSFDSEKLVSYLRILQLLAHWLRRRFRVQTGFDMELLLRNCSLNVHRVGGVTEKLPMQCHLFYSFIFLQFSLGKG